MTQEELDALMASDNIDDIQVEDSKEDETFEVNVQQEQDMVHQLNSVTVDSEKKGTEIMNNLDMLLNEIAAISTCIQNNEQEKALKICDDVQNIIFETMSVMQYQDIHRQKIERVINTMVKISGMMNDSLSSVVGSIAPSAKHIDAEDGESISEEELAALIAANNS